MAWAESRNLALFERVASGRFEATAVPFKGGWGSVAFARLTKDGAGELITANNADGSITIYFWSNSEGYAHAFPRWGTASRSLP